MYHGQFINPRVDEYLHKTFFSNILGGFFIEAGAYDGITDSSCLFFEQDLGWKGINLEPCTSLFNELQVNRPTSINLNLAITNNEQSGKQVMFEEMLFKDRHKAIGHGYITEITTDRAKRVVDRPENTRGARYSVTGISYDELLVRNNIQHVDLLVLDIEGGEETVLKDLTSHSKLPTVICLEDNFMEIDKFKNILEPIGYVFHSRIHVNDHFILRNLK